MSDIHDTKDLRNIAINNVGICDYFAPFTFINGKEKYITIAEIKAGVSLNEDTKGAHLSRINMIINNEIVNKDLTIADIKKITQKIANEVGVNNANLEMSFKIGLNFQTPKSNLPTNLYSDLKIYIKVVNNEVIDEYLKISANVAMLCPNSKTKSKYGAHSQKCLINLTMYDNISKINVREIYQIICNAGSAPVFDTVRSTDEVYITELAYDNPKFSEDAIRDLLIMVRKKYKKGLIKAELKNFESIHQHNVYCEGEN